MNSLKAMYGCGLNFFIKLAYNSLFLYKFADEKKEEKNSFILYTFVKFALVTEQKLNIEEYSIFGVNPCPFKS